RTAYGVSAAAGIHLYQAAFDLARRPDGDWRLVQVRAQTPAGAGYALENRTTILRMFPDAFYELHARAIAPYFGVFKNTLARFAPADVNGSPQIVLLTPGPYSGRYFEHAYLARYFGFPLVEGADLTVRQDRLYLKTISGLRQVHGVVRQLADDFCDPLELRADSTLGVPGLLQVWRSGRVLVANTFGSGALESAALRPYLPAACEHLLGEPLRPLAIPDDGAGAHTPDTPASYAPVWHEGRMESRPLLLRVFAVATGDGTYAVMPGGLARIAAPAEPAVTKGSGGSKDTWVLSPAPIGPRLAEQRIAALPFDTSRVDGSVSSRAAEHLFWHARYIERSDMVARLLRTALTRLSDPSAPPLQDATFLRVCVMNGLLDARDLETDGAAPHREPPAVNAESAVSLSRRLIENLFDQESRKSLAFNVRHGVRAAAAIRDRLSGDNWRLLNHLFGLMSPPPSGASSASLHDVIGLLERSIVSLSAVAGIEIGHMRRDYGWRFLSIGRHLERLLSVSTTFAALRGEDAVDPEVLEWLLEVLDSLVTFRARYLRAPEWRAVVELLVFDAQNPRSVAFQIHRIARGVPQLPGSVSTEILSEIERLERWSQTSDEPQPDLFGVAPPLERFFDDCQRVALQVSDALTLRYFSHAYDLRVTSA
ncbi:MAG TPA: circularly permuted type 2 ATP-grasp protein, partial [Vicinamibacterales bacterium]